MSLSLSLVDVVSEPERAEIGASVSQRVRSASERKKIKFFPLVRSQDRRGLFAAYPKQCSTGASERMRPQNKYPATCRAICRVLEPSCKT